MGVVAINRRSKEAEEFREAAANGECKGVKPGEVSGETVDCEDIFCVTDCEGNVTPMDAGQFCDFVKMVAREKRLRDRTDSGTLGEFL